MKTLSLTTSFQVVLCMEEGYRLLYAQGGAITEQLYQTVHEKVGCIQGLSIRDCTLHKTGFHGLDSSCCLNHQA